MKAQQKKEYNITYLDNKGNVLQWTVKSFYTKKEAILYAKEVLDTYYYCKYGTYAAYDGIDIAIRR